MNAIAQMDQGSKMPPLAANDVTPPLQCRPAMAINVQSHNGLARIVLSGRFDFQMRLDFKNSYVPLLDNVAVHEILVDMSRVIYLDSSAMGMLLLLDDRAKTVNKPVVLLTASGFVSQALEVANFSKIFNIKHIGSGNRSLSGLPPAMVSSSFATD